MDELLEINRYVGQSLRWLVDMSQSCKWLAVSVGRCGLTAILLDRIVYSVVVGSLLIAWSRSLCSSVAVGRLLWVGCCRVAVGQLL